MRKLLLGLILTAGLISPAYADTPPTAVLIDSGINGALFSSNIVYEACFIEYTTCPNGKNSMEGTGSAQQVPSKNMEVNHGEQMLSIMVKVNPNIKVIPIKIMGVTAQGNPMLYTLDSVKSALDWTVANKTKFNISVVSISQGAIFAGCRVPAGMAEDIATLKANNVQVVVATGNNSNRTTMMSPACLSDSISVGATDNPWGGAQPLAWDSTAKPYIARYSNGNTQTTLYSNARWIVTNLDGTTKFMVGTSNSTASVSAWVMLNKGVDYNSTYQNLIAGASGTASNEWLSGRYLLINQ
jgi:hypothetical protein